MIVEYVTKTEWDTLINGGYMVVVNPSRYPYVFSYHGKFCVWHRESI